MFSMSNLGCNVRGPNPRSLLAFPDFIHSHSPDIFQTSLRETKLPIPKKTHANARKV